MTTSIAFLINWNNQQIEPNLLTLINQCVSHHCPDGKMIWYEGNVGMTQADLATLPEDEPDIHISWDNLHIVASCRIDNRDEILNNLPQKYLPKSNSDSALILASYQFYGENFIDKLIGDFAFIIWDANQQKILAARDLSGTRQLYYYSDHNKLIIASDRTQIFQDSSINLSIDESQIIEYLTPSFLFSSGWDLGLFEGVKALNAGCILIAQQGKINIRKYWQWQESKIFENRPDSEILTEYLAILTEAVKCRLRSKEKIAVELSGGLDSPAIACLAAELFTQNNKPLHSLSMVFKQVPEIDETEKIQKVLTKYPIIPHFLEAADFYKPQCLKPNWQPLTLMSPHEMLASAFFELYDMAVNNDIKVVLTGLSGDALNYGSDRLYYDLLRRGKWQEAWRRIKVESQYSVKQALSKLFLDGLLPFTPFPLLQLSLSLRALKRSYQGKEKLPNYFTPKLKQQIFIAEQKIRLESVQENQCRCSVARETLSYIYPPFVLLTMPFPQAIERRHPYGDRRLIEFVLSMPASLKWEENKRGFNVAGRFHHRQALQGIMPEMLINNNNPVEFSPVLKHSFPPQAILNWLKSSPIIYIFEQDYVIPELFLEEITTRKNSMIYLLSILSLESWFRFIYSKSFV